MSDVNRPNVAENVLPPASPSPKRQREDKTTVSLFTWAALLLFALAVLIIALVASTDAGFFSSFFGFSLVPAFVALGFAITGVVRSRVKWPAVTVLALSASASLGPFLFLLVIILISLFR